MANICSFIMKVDDSETSKILAEWLDNDYTECFHFCRTSDIYCDEERAIIYGDCAWSVYGCLIDHHEGCLTLYEAAQRLNTPIEVYSCELGMEFYEHVYVDPLDLNEVKIYESGEYAEIDKSEYENLTIVEIEQTLGIKIDEQRWNNDDSYYIVCEVDFDNINWLI